MSSTTQLQKIERVAQKYGLDDIGDELVAYWDDGGPDKSTRELAAYFNYHVTDTALRNAGIILDREVVESIAEKLGTDKARLTESEFGERDVDLREVKEDLVTYQTVYTYLCEIRGIEYTKTSRDKSQYLSTLRKLHGRVEMIDRDTAAKLVQRDEIDGPTPNIDVDVTAQCPACHSKTNLLIYLSNGGCPTPECADHA
ncbi:hypothetical protein JCM17823_06350 [Halorubrum gandharaense]